MLGGELANRDSNHTEKADDNVTDAGILPAGRSAVRRDVGQGDLRRSRRSRNRRALKQTPAHREERFLGADCWTSGAFGEIMHEERNTSTRNHS